MVVEVARESICNGDDDQKYVSLEYKEGDLGIDEMYCAIYK